VLRSFRMENHRSFRDEAELSLLPAYDRSRTTVPVAAVYGANAAGKSNLFDGLRFVCAAVAESYRRWSPTGGIPRSPFLLGNGRDQPSTYVIELSLDGVRYVYGFVVDDVQVREEWLHCYPKGRRRILFDRDGTKFDLGESLRSARAKADVLSELTRRNALFLSLAAQVGIEDVMPVYNWLANGGVLRLSTSERFSFMPNTAVVEAIRGSDADQGRFLSLLQAADIGISEVVVQEEPAINIAKFGPDVHLELDYLKKPVPDSKQSTSENAPAGIESPFVDLLGGERTTYTPVRLQFRHAEGELFDLADESAGTRSWLSLLPKVLTALDHGALLMIDEIDASLHPNLTALLIRQFQSTETNPRNAQLLFTTHDATLLGTSYGEELLARDQIWFVEKDATGASRLYPLTDFHPRTGENRERRYLSGSYGGVPIIGDPRLRQPSRPKLSDS
jgi:predicted ATPase